MVKIQQRVLLDFAKISPKWAEIYQTYRFGVMMNDKFCIDTLCKTKKNGLNLDIKNSIYCLLG